MHSGPSSFVYPNTSTLNRMRPSLPQSAYVSARPPSRRTGYPAARVVPTSISAAGARRMQEQYEAWHATDDDDSTPPPDAVYPPMSITSIPVTPRARHSTPPLFNVTASCNDPSGDEEELTPPEIMHDRQRRRTLVESDDDDLDEEDYTNRPIRRIRAAPRKIEWIDQGSSSYSAGRAGGVPAIPPEILLPHAKFFIEKRKHVVSLKFDPPV